MKKQLLFVALLAIVFLGKAQIADEWDHLRHSWDFENEDASDLKGMADGTVEATVADRVIFANGNAILTATGANSDGGYITLPGPFIGIEMYDAFSLECWVTPNPGANTGGHNMLFYIGGQTDADPATGINYFFFTPSKLDPPVMRAAMNAYDSWNEDGVEGDGLEEERMYHAVTTVEAGLLTLYVDGDTIGSIALKEDNTIANLLSDYAYIGAGGYRGDGTWAGTVHKISLYDIALTKEEIEWLYNHEDKDKHQPTNVGISKADRIKPVLYVSDGGLFAKGIDEIPVKSVRVYNITGSMLYQVDNFKNGMKLNLSSGIYIVEIENHIESIRQKIRID